MTRPADLVARPFRPRPRTDTRPKFKNPVPCARCSGSGYDGGDYCLACDGCGKEEGPPPLPRPARPCSPVETRMVDAFAGVAEAHAALVQAVGRAIGTVREAEAVGVAPPGAAVALETMRRAAGGDGLATHAVRFGQWAIWRLKRAEGPT